MDDPVVVRNSRGLTVFAEIVRSPAGTLRAVELAGRGIAAQARCELSIPVTDKLPHDIPADHIMRDTMAFADRVGGA